MSASRNAPAAPSNVRPAIRNKSARWPGKKRRSALASAVLKCAMCVRVLMLDKSSNGTMNNALSAQIAPNEMKGALNVPQAAKRAPVKNVRACQALRRAVKIAEVPAGMDHRRAVMTVGGRRAVMVRRVLHLPRRAATTPRAI